MRSNSSASDTLLAARRELAMVGAMLIANRDETDAMRNQFRPLTVRRADQRGLVPESFWDRSSALAAERSELLSRQYDLRIAAGLNPMSGLPPEPSRPAQITQDESGGGWYPDLLGPTDEVRGWCSGAVTEMPAEQFRGDIVRHGHCDDMYRHHLRLEHDGEVVTGLTLKAKRPWRGEQSAKIDRVFTSEEHRRHGHARQLLGYAKSHFRSVRHSRDLTDQGRAWRWSVRNNPDEQTRRLERAALSGDLQAQLKLDQIHRRMGVPVMADQLAAVDKSVALNEEHGGHRLLFPGARAWRDLFVREMPTVDEVNYPLPPELHGAGFRAVRDWIRKEGIEERLNLKPGGKPGVGYDEFSWTLENKKPDWAAPFTFTERVYSRRGRGPGRDIAASIDIGPYLSVSGPDSYSSMYVRARPEVYDAIRASMIAAGVNDQIDFRVTIRGDREPRTALVSATNNTIIGGRWLAVIPALEVPWAYQA